MEFCPICDSLLQPLKTTKKSVRFKCPKCGYEKRTTRGKSTAYAIKDHIRHTPSDKIVVLDKEFKSLPTERMECPRCHNMKVYTWQLQTRSSDEPTTTFYRCTKCSHTWREY